MLSPINIADDFRRIWQQIDNYLNLNLSCQGYHSRKHYTDGSLDAMIDGAYYD